MQSLADASAAEAAHGDRDKDPGDIDALFVVVHEAMPVHELAEGLPDDPLSGTNLEARIVVGAATDIDDTVEEAGLVLQLGTIVGAVDREVFHEG